MLLSWRMGDCVEAACLIIGHLHLLMQASGLAICWGPHCRQHSSSPCQACHSSRRQGLGPQEAHHWAAKARPSWRRRPKSWTPSLICWADVMLISPAVYTNACKMLSASQAKQLADGGADLTDQCKMTASRGVGLMPPGPLGSSFDRFMF